MDTASVWKAMFHNSYTLDALPQSTVDYLEKHTAQLRKGKLLDNGCGSGRLKKYFEKVGWNCYGIDVSEFALRAASRESPPNLILGSSDDLPFKDNFFDLVVSFRVLHNLSEEERSMALIEMERVAKKGAVCLLIVQSREDEKTFNYYRERGELASSDENTVMVPKDINGKYYSYFRHFFSHIEITDLVARVAPKFLINNIEQFHETSGFRKSKPRDQIYWALTLTKQ